MFCSSSTLFQHLLHFRVVLILFDHSNFFLEVFLKKSAMKPAKKSISSTPSKSTISKPNTSTVSTLTIEELQSQLIENPVANVNHLATIFERLIELDLQEQTQRDSIKIDVSSMIQCFDVLLSKKMVRFDISALNEESKSAAQLKFRQFVGEKYKQFKKYFVKLICSNVNTPLEVFYLFFPIQCIYITFRRSKF